MSNQLLINTENLKSYTLPSIDKLSEEIQYALDVADYLDVPYGFSYRTYLNGLATTINTNKNNVKYVRDFVTKSIISFNGINTSAHDFVKAISVYDIKAREPLLFVDK